MPILFNNQSDSVDVLSPFGFGYERVLFTITQLYITVVSDKRDITDKMFKMQLE